MLQVVPLPVVLSTTARFVVAEGPYPGCDADRVTLHHACNSFPMAAVAFGSAAGGLRQGCVQLIELCPLDPRVLGCLYARDERP